MIRGAIPNMKKVLITGASGFVGNNLARFLLGRGHETHLLLRKGHAQWRLNDILGDVRVHTADLCDPGGLTAAVKNARADWIFHLAAHGAYSSQMDTARIVQTNIMGTVNLVQACLKAGFEVLVNTGSSSEYGFKDHAPSENEWLDPNSYYAVAKASATMFCRYTARSLGLRIPTLRLYSVYGPYEEPTRLMPTLIVNGLEGRLPPLVNPKIGRDFVYVADATAAYLLAATAELNDPGAVYNIGSGIQTSIAEIVETARRSLSINEEPAWGSMQDRIWDTDTWICDNRLAVEKLGWRPNHSFGDGFRKMVDWFRENPEIMRQYRDRQHGNAA
jgi:nucleoside-diphosphate-sugar epimerase